MLEEKPLLGYERASPSSLGYASYVTAMGRYIVHRYVAAVFKNRFGSVQILSPSLPNCFVTARRFPHSITSYVSHDSSTVVICLLQCLPAKEPEHLYGAIRPIQRLFRNRIARRMSSLPVHCQALQMLLTWSCVRLGVYD